MKRRTFVLAAVGTLSGLAWLSYGMTPEEAIVMVIRKRLNYLKLESEGLKKFAQDTIAKHALSSGRIHLLAAIRPVYERTELSSGTNYLAYLLRHGEDRIVSSYLISTDFFVNGADDTRTVQYLGLIDSRRACGNPFARLVV
jgi:hypothetical protein